MNFRDILLISKMEIKFNFYFAFSSSLFVIVSLLTFQLIYNVQPTPFIDEAFHVPQAIQYCNGSYDKWDPKITTLPGLYLLSVGAITLLSGFTGYFECTVYSLRLVNIVASIFNFYIIYNILQEEQRKVLRKSDEKLISWSTINIAFFPVLYFFTSFYYTDVMSTVLVLLMYLLHQLDRHWSSSLIGLLAVLVRQTNVVWVGFIMINTYNSILQDFDKRLGSNPLQSFDQTMRATKKMYTSMWNSKSFLESCKIHLPLLGYLLVCLLFMVFLILNGGIVVGDKSAHEPTLHFVQILYFLLFFITFSFPHFVGKLKSFVFFSTRYWKFSCMCLIFFGLLVYFNTLSHPYLLADNRHYTFYVWKNLYASNFMLKYLLIPIYIFGLYCVDSVLCKKSFLFTVSYWVSICLCLVPQKLFEFRYFILPFIILRLSIKHSSSIQLLMESFLYVSLNLFTIYIFVTKEFYWTDSADVQRIMW